MDNAKTTNPGESSNGRASVSKTENEGSIPSSLASPQTTPLIDQPTQRGFSRYEFTDSNGVKCSLQKSSAAFVEKIWLGCNDIGLRRFTPGKGWEDVTLEQDINGIHHVANDRMHLTQEQVAALLPILQRFVETGEIYEQV